MEDILKIAKKLNLKKADIQQFGKYKAKILFEKIEKKLKKLNKNTCCNSKLILVTAMTPTDSGEGKTTIAIGLADALNYINKKATLVLREPSMGPFFGKKGGATGANNTIIEPSEDINLHFNGDLHAITTANNLIAAAIDNHIYYGNALNIDKNRIFHKRCIDINDRALRNIQLSINLKDENKREEHFILTAGTELMAIMCLAKNKSDLKNRLQKIIIAKNMNGKNVYLKDLKIVDALMLILKDCINPNLVQTKYSTPVIVHGGPFANIAHGSSSVISLKTSMLLSDYTITEAGFGSDLGGEKFLNITRRNLGITPNLIILTITIKAIKNIGETLKNGFENVLAHYNIMKKFSKVLVCINDFKDDKKEEKEELKELLEKNNIPFESSSSFLNGPEGSKEFAKKVVEMTKQEGKTKDTYYTYDLNDSIKEKIFKIAKNIYGAEVKYTDNAIKKIKEIEKKKEQRLLPICIAKTPFSFGADSKNLQFKNHTIEVKDLILYNGAGFIVAIVGNILLMPGFNNNPRYLNMKYKK